MKKITLIAISILAILFFFSCVPTPQDLIVGIWEADMGDGESKINIKADGTFEVLEDIDSTETVVENGTWTLADNILSITMEETYNETSGELVAIGEGDMEKQDFTLTVGEDQAIMMALIGGNTETLIGTWTSSMEMTYYNSDEVDESMSIELILNDDDTYEMTLTMYDAEATPPEQEMITTGTWEYDGTDLTMTPDGEDASTGTVVIIGDGMAITGEEMLFFGFVLNRVEE